MPGRHRAPRQPGLAKRALAAEGEDRDKCPPIKTNLRNKPGKLAGNGHSVRGNMIDHVISAVADGVQTIRFDRIEAENALTATMCELTADAISFGESSSRVRAILVTGGPGIFTAGHDVDELAAFADQGAIGESVIRLLKTLATVDKPVVAAVDGPAACFRTTLL